MKPRLYIENMYAGRTHRRKPMMSDPIIEEVCRARKEIEAEHTNDWKALEKFFKDKQEAAPEKKATYKPRRLPRQTRQNKNGGCPE